MAQSFMQQLAGWAILAMPPAFALEQFASQVLDETGHVTVRHCRGKGQNNRRGKGARNRPKARSNRLIVSKRVRRKHRRAA